jgi:hypothetical protein
MELYNAEFTEGTYIQIRPHHFLEEFQRTWKLHHALQNTQLDYADKTATVKSIGYYHGGDVLYWLNEIPGIWHEACLQRPTISK